MYRILLVDDHALIRNGIRLLLTTYPDVEIVGEAADGAEALQEALRLTPDVILMDLSMPHGVDGFIATSNILRDLPESKVILLTMYDEEEYIQKAIHVQAHGYILKKCEGNELYEAIQAVCDGKLFYRTGLPDTLMNKMFLQKRKPVSILTNREQEVVRLIMLGFTNMEIARKLVISIKTVENHRTNVMNKLGLRSKHELIRYGLQNRYLDLTV